MQTVSEQAHVVAAVTFLAPGAVELHRELRIEPV
jgi:hypothetical protein